MAPACSIREFADAVVPTLKTPDQNAYVFTLHPRVEAGERMGISLFPRGSILEWLEGFLDPPNTHLDRMLGKWDNVIRALRIFPTPVRDRIRIKAFPYDTDPRNAAGDTCKEPKCHVEFNDADT